MKYIFYFFIALVSALLFVALLSSDKYGLVKAVFFSGKSGDTLIFLITLLIFFIILHFQRMEKEDKASIKAKQALSETEQSNSLIRGFLIDARVKEIAINIYQLIEKKDSSRLKEFMTEKCLTEFLKINGPSLDKGDYFFFKRVTFVNARLLTFDHKESRDEYSVVYKVKSSITFYFLWELSRILSMRGRSHLIQKWTLVRVRGLWLLDSII